VSSRRNQHPRDKRVINPIDMVIFPKYNSKLAWWSIVLSIAVPDQL
jgi:hypothetical protein